MGAPYNYKARLIEFTTTDGGKSWKREVLFRGEGTQEATYYDIDNDGELEIIGKDPWEAPYGKPRDARVHYWKKAKEPSPIASYRHRFLDRDKSLTGSDIIAADVDGDGGEDVFAPRGGTGTPAGNATTSGILSCLQRLRH